MSNEIFIFFSKTPHREPRRSTDKIRSFSRKKLDNQNFMEYKYLQEPERMRPAW